MKAQMIVNGKEVELIPSEDWTTRELSTAEHALGVRFGASAGDELLVMMFVSAKRVMPETQDFVLADAVGRVKFGEMQKALDALPLEDEETTTNGRAPLPTSGTSPSEPTESPSTSET